MKISIDLGTHYPKTIVGGAGDTPAPLLVNRDLRDQIYAGVSLGIEKLGQKAANMIEVVTFGYNNLQRLEIRMVILPLKLLDAEQRRLTQLREVNFTDPATLADTIVEIFAGAVAQDKLNVKALLEAYGSVHDPRKKLCSNCREVMKPSGQQNGGYLCESCFCMTPIEAWSER